MKLTFLGGADEVGASSILVESSGRRILVDAGIRPSPKSRWGRGGYQLPDLSQMDQSGPLDAVLVTHAHTDHTGALELVTGRFPDVPVYATSPTIALTRVLHQDSRRIMQTCLEEEGELPLFDHLAVERLLLAFVPVPFNMRTPLFEGLAATFYPAGHIAGAAMVCLESDEGRLLLSGDISVSPQRTSVPGATQLPTAGIAVSPGGPPGNRMEINAAYATLKASLAGTTLYRTSLKGDEIFLSFISRQVGERYLAEIEELAQEIGWPLRINPQPNQNAITQVAHALLAQAGWEILKGLSIYLDRSEVGVSLAELPEQAEVARVQSEFEAQTGFHLAIEAVKPSHIPVQSSLTNSDRFPADVTEIPVARIRLRTFYQNVSLDPEKLRKAVERARRIGQIAPPVQVRRGRSGNEYILIDGLYRLRAAQALGWERIPALIE